MACNFFAVWLQIVHQAFNCTRLDDLQSWHRLQTGLHDVSANTTLQEGANQAVAVIRYSWCRAVGFIRAADGCLCAVGLSCAVCVLAMWLNVWLQDDTYMCHDTSRRTRAIPVVVDRSNNSA